MITNTELLNYIEKEKLNAQEICQKADIKMGTLRRRHHILMLNEHRFIDIPGLIEDDNTVELKKGGITLSTKKLDSLKNPHELGTKFSIEINHKSKKIILTPQ